MSDGRMILIDLTQGDEPVITYSNAKKRRALGDITKEIDNCENMGEARPLVRRRRRRVESSQSNQENVRPPQQTGRGVTGNPWIRHVKDFAKKHNITYWEALKNPATKKAYKKGGGNFFKDLGKTIAKPFELGGVNPFEAGYDLGHDKIAPALLGKKK